jgi:hypothetical protein
MDTPSQNVSPVPPKQSLGLSSRSKGLIVIGLLLLIGSAVVYFGPSYGIDIGRFFAAEPGVTGNVAVTNPVKLYPVVDNATSTVRFVLETGVHEITGVQFKASITGASYTDIASFTGSSVFGTVLEQAHVLSDGALGYAAGVAAGAAGATAKTTVATVRYAVPTGSIATQVCATVQMSSSIVTAKGMDASVLDATLSGWSNTACAPIATPTSTPAPVIASFTANPASIVSGNSTVLSWNVSGAITVSIDSGVGAVSGTTATVMPTTTTAYTLTATGPGGTTTRSVTVTVTQPTPLPAVRGDANGDRKVDIMDFNIVVANFGRTPSTSILGDVTKNGTIDILDFNAVVTFFGTVTLAP